MVRIRDRRLGIPYCIFLLGVAGYIIFNVIFEQAYMKIAAVSGVTRLQVR
jgi:hypothetical protein